MTASYFHTILTADARTNPTGSGAQYAAPMSQQPRWTDPGAGREGWVSAHLHAEKVIQIAAQAIADTPMEGLTADHPDKRHQIVTVLDAVAAAVRTLALDADGNSALTDEKWKDATDAIYRALIIPFPDLDGPRVTRMEIITER